MILAPGLDFGPYLVIGPLASGGMGEVYRARDRRLGREVALKVLVEEAAEGKRAHRFEQEARAASALNHPNIVVVYEIGEAPLAGRERPLHYLAMELLDGVPLASVLMDGPVPLRRLLDLAAQIADGLARAHESGIVHRDLKPSNIVVTSSGRAKILDFGLAKLRGDDFASLATEEDTMPGTAPGSVLGTVGYMSPEQARGEMVSAASDQFAFGCILYEMATGHRAFRRPSAAETLSAVLRDEPAPIEEVAPGTPALLRWIVARCLAKVARDRYASTLDLAHDLRTLKEHSAEIGLHTGPEPVQPAAARSLRPWAAALALLGLGAAVALALSRSFRAPPQPEFRRLTYRHGAVWRASFVPGSNAILYTASWDWQSPRTYQTLPDAPGLDRSLDAETQLPMAYSADGTRVLVLLGATRPAINLQGTLAWWPSLGGRARPILERAGWADWSEGAELIVVSRDAGAERVLEARDGGGALKRTLFRTAGGLSFVKISPDGKRVAFIHHPDRYDDAGEVRLVSLDGSAERPPLTRRYERCFGLDWNRRTGDVWFSAAEASDRGSALRSVDTSARMRTVLPLPDFSVLQGVSPAGDQCLLVTSENRMSMMVRRGGETPRDLTWLGWSAAQDISPDQKSVLFMDYGAATSGAWIRPVDGGDAVRIGESEPSRFSPDGKWVVGLSRPRSGFRQLVLMPVAAGLARQLTASAASHSWPTFLGPDRLLFVRSGKSGDGIFTMRIDGTEERPLGVTGCETPEASPNGQSYVCRGGPERSELFVHPLTGAPGRRLAGLPKGERFVYARWDASGARIFAVTTAGRFLRLDAGDGSILSQEALPSAASAGFDRPVGVAITADGELQAYSVSRVSSGLYLCTGLH